VRALTDCLRLLTLRRLLFVALVVVTLICCAGDQWDR
jgi:hypothetical protein